MDFSPQPLTRVPLYRQLEEVLRQDILTKRKAGDRLGTESELARTFSVSIATVRQALAELANKGLIERRQGSGTYVARQSSEKHVAIWIEGDVTSLSPFYLHALQSLRKALSAAGQASRPYLGFSTGMVDPTNITCQDLLTDLRLGRLKAIFPLLGRLHPSWATEVESHGVPVIGWGPFYPQTIDSDSEMALNLVLEQMSRRGRKRLAVIGWDNWYSNRKPLLELLEKVAPQWGFQLEPAFLQLRAHGSQEGIGWESLREIWISCPTKPDCFLVTDETLFQDCVQAIRDLKINVPHDLDVGLLTVDWFKEDVDFPIFKAGFHLAEMGHALVKVLRLLDAGEEIPARTVVPAVRLPLNTAEWAETALSDSQPLPSLSIGREP